MDNLESKYKRYMSLIKKHQDKHGFILTEECDSLLFSGLIGSLEGLSVDIEAAKDPSTGQWFRRPTDLPECFKCGSSKATISRDMLLGALYYFYFNKRLDLITQVLDYALKHKFIMGQASDTKMLLGRCLLSPGLLGTYALAYYKLGGKGPKALLRFLPNVESSKLDGFQAHLTVLHLLLRRHLKEDKNYGSKVAEAYANQNPENALYQYAAGNLEQAKAILSNQALFPADRLPTNLDRKSGWLWQREFEGNYQPAIGKPKEEHTGGDFLFAYALVSGRLM